LSAVSEWADEATAQRRAMPPLVQKAGLGNDKNRIPTSERFQRVIAYDVAHRFCVPPAAVQDRLLALRVKIPSRLRAHPACLARFVAKQPIQEFLCRRRHPLVANKERSRAFTSRSAQSSSVASIDPLDIHNPRNHGGPWIQ
jgi:hypothetical protein